MNWKGVFPALTTKFYEDGSLDTGLFRSGISQQLDAGVHGLIVGGSLGEPSTLGASEKLELLQVAIDAVAGRVPVLLNIAEGATAEAVRQAKAAAERGASGLMLLPPMRYRSDSREALAYFKTVAEATELPIMLYNNPVDYGITITLEMFAELAHHPTFQAVKESTRDVTNVIRMRNRFGDRYAILCGVDTLALESLVNGADGWVAGLVNAFPEETVALYNLVQDNRIAEAVSLYKWFMPLLELDIQPKLVQYIKMAEAITGKGSEHVRPPRLPLTGAERNAIENIIRRAVASKPVLPHPNNLS